METIISIAVVSILTSKPGLAQIVPDATLGNQSSRVTTGVNIKGNEADLIEGGAQRGSSLFHSFAEFNVNNGQRVYFANPTAIDNIFSRVTGNNPSNILGTLGVNGGANLFLLNPNGIIFGKNAQLDIQGSFLATTANSFKFPDGSEFSATNPQAPPLLTMSVPVGVQYGLQQTASITNQGNLVTGANLTLSAGNLDLQGTLQAGGDLTLQGQDSLKVRDSASNAFIAAATGKILVQGNKKVDIYALNHPDSGFFSGGDMVLQSKNTIGGDAHYWAGGNFRIEQLNGDLGNLFSPDDPVIRASGDVSFGSYKGASLHILAGGSVNIEGNVTINAVDSTSNSIKESVKLSDETKIDIDGSTTPTLDIRAGVSLNKIGNPGFTPNPLIASNLQNPQTTNTPTSANISIGGNIYNTSGAQDNNGLILITNQYEANKELTGHITTGLISTYGNVSIDSRGNITTNGKIDTTINGSVKQNLTAGKITLLADQNILIQNEILSNVNDKISGNGGDIYLNSQNGKIDIKADIISKTESGIGGNVTIKASGDISVTGKKIEADSKSDITTNPSNKIFNNITINSTSGSVYLDGFTLNTTNNGSGLAGDIRINASDEISLINESQIFSQGNFGRIFIDTGSLTLSNGSQINSSLVGTGNQVGTITIKAKDTVKLDGDPTLKETSEQPNPDQTKENPYSVQTGIFTLIDKNAQLDNSNGKGNINLTANKLIITNGARLSADTYGTGDAGDITVNAPQIELSNQGRIISVVRESANGNSGDITLYTATLSITDDARISASIQQGNGKAGNVTINASDSVLLKRNGRISSSVRKEAGGIAGNIDITTHSLTAADQGIIEAQSQGEGNGGDINIKTQNLQLRRQSNISTTAGTANVPGNGGNITITAENGFVIAEPTEDSNIIANSFGGKGGTIKIRANRILGFENRPKLTPEQLENLQNNGTSDINASSDVDDDGEVSIDTLSIDPSQGLVALPANLVDPSNLIAQGCGSANDSVAKGESKFVITGRGGLPPSPDDTLKAGVMLPEWVVGNTPKYSNNPENITVKEMNLKQLSSTVAPLVEAVGMVRNADGDIVLTAQPTTASLLQSGLSSQVCNVAQENVR